MAPEMMLPTADMVDGYNSFSDRAHGMDGRVGDSFAHPAKERLTFDVYNAHELVLEESGRATSAGSVVGSSKRRA